MKMAPPPAFRRKVPLWFLQQCGQVSLAFGIASAGAQVIGLPTGPITVIMGGGAFILFAACFIWNSRAQLGNCHRVYLRSLATFELNKPEWLSEFYRCKREGEEAERRQIELKKTETRVEAQAVIGVTPRGDSR